MTVPLETPTNAPINWLPYKVGGLFLLITVSMYLMNKVAFHIEFKFSKHTYASKYDMVNNSLKANAAFCFLMAIKS